MSARPLLWRGCCETFSARFHQKHLRRNCCSPTGDWKTSANLWWNSAEIFSILMRGSIIGTLDTILLSHTVSKHWNSGFEDSRIDAHQGPLPSATIESRTTRIVFLVL